jgi:hypothetical protein
MRLQNTQWAVNNLEITVAESDMSLSIEETKIMVLRRRPY